MATKAVEDTLVVLTHSGREDLAYDVLVGAADQQKMSFSASKFGFMLCESVVMSDDPFHAIEHLEIMEEFGVERDKHLACFGACAYRKLCFKDLE